MKKIFISTLLWGLIIPCIFSQNTWTIVEEYGKEVGHHYQKRVENNFWFFPGNYNLDSKNETEKLFFGDFNAPIEFFYGHHFDGPSGFRVQRDSLRKTHVLEVKYVSNFIEADKEISDKYQSSSTSIDSMKALSKKKYEERLKLYKVETFTFPVSDPFADSLYEKMLSFIIHFKSKGFYGIGSVYSVTFRTVVNNDELWTLRINDPGGNARKWSDFCRKIVKDAVADDFYEERYIYMLNTF